ncbi:MAG: T9SS type A sorting domain-containing protein [Lewinellaceae bacterium]|nr:T9SS type A sorting domain-containing protein [Lewinellaceae bacterium]
MRRTCLVACLITAILPAFFTAQVPNGAGFHLVQQPEPSEIEPTGFRLSWETSVPTTAAVYYGADPSSLSAMYPVYAAAATHSVVLTGLQPGTVYWVRIANMLGSDTLYSLVLPFATRSLSSGQIKIYFSQGIDPAAAGGLLPDGDTYEAVYLETLARINAAEKTLDVAMYNTNRADLVNAVKAAHARGVRVRYIAAAATANTALKPPPLFPVLYGNDSALMHNKFLVIDTDLTDKAWVVGGSMNWTNTNMVDDHNNTLCIQDQSLARTYELEFNEMWGSSGALPDPAASRFGSAKTDNTPHHFVIGGRSVSCYFSPSDQVTQRIEEAVRSADHQVGFALFSFTKNELGNALIAEHNSGTWVRGIIENINDQGTEYNWLRSNGVPVQAHPASPALHHKYAVLDAGYPASEPTVVTGSHNWSQNAESNNDEHTLIIRDADLAVLFQAEFERRWAEISTSTATIAGQTFEVFPNPVRDRLFLRHSDGSDQPATLEVRDAAGRLWLTANTSGPLAEISWPAALPAGVYIVSIKTESGAAAFSIQAFPR